MIWVSPCNYFSISRFSLQADPTVPLWTGRPLNPRQSWSSNILLRNAARLQRKPN
jgi:hypothetical protein